MKIYSKKDHKESCICVKEITGVPKIYVRCFGNILSGIVGTEYNDQNICLFKKFTVERSQFSSRYEVSHSVGSATKNTRKEALEEFKAELKKAKEELESELKKDAEDMVAYQGFEVAMAE